MDKEDAMKKCKKCGARKEKYKAMKEADLMKEREKRLPQDSDSEDSFGFLDSEIASCLLVLFMPQFSQETLMI